jgi:hypothetical protein
MPRAARAIDDLKERMSFLLEFSVSDGRGKPRRGVTARSD